jgi:hypothetical protein
MRNVTLKWNVFNVNTLSHTYILNLSLYVTYCVAVTKLHVS